MTRFANRNFTRRALTLDCALSIHPECAGAPGPSGAAENWKQDVKTAWMNAWRGWLPVLLVALGLSGCGGGSDSATKANVRLVNASKGYSTLSLSLNDSAVQTGVAYGGTAGYAQVDPSNTSAAVGSPSAASTLSSSTLNLSKKNYYTVLAYGKAGALSTLELDDNTGGAGSGKTLLRVINTAADAGALDVYVTGSSDSLSASTPSLSAQTYGSLSTFATINSASWRVRVTAAGSKTDVRLDLPAVNFASQAVLTLVLTPGDGGVLVHGLLLAQQGDVLGQANTQARVRVVAGVTGNGAVSAVLGGSALVNAVAAPAQTSYTLVNAGTLSLAATANGTAAGLGSVTLNGGNDYTLLVYGTPSAPVAVLLADDNSNPSDTTRAKLRLAHGLADVSGALSMKLNFVVLADGVTQGSASAYSLADASTTAQLTVDGAGSGTLYSSAANLTLLANGNYTLFMVGSAAAPVALLSKDR